MRASAEEQVTLAKVQDSTTWTDKGSGDYVAHKGATLSELGKLTGQDYKESSFYDSDPERRAETLQIGETVSFQQPITTSANIIESNEPTNAPPNLPGNLNQSNWEKYAGVELIGVGATIAGAGGIALTGAGTTGIAATGLTAAGVIGGGGTIALGIGIIAIGIDLIEGQGLDKTTEFINWLIGAY